MIARSAFACLERFVVGEQLGQLGEGMVEIQDILRGETSDNFRQRLTSFDPPSELVHVIQAVGLRVQEMEHLQEALFIVQRRGC